MDSICISSVPLLVPAEKRKAPRTALRLGNATLESAIFYETVPMVDLGRLGFSVRTTVAYPQGCRLTLHLEGYQPMPAHAVWHARNRLGASFDEPLADDVLASLIGEA